MTHDKVLTVIKEFMFNAIYLGDSLESIKTFPDESIDCVVTSPPYYALRDYGIEGQIGLEDTPEQYIERLVVLFREIRRVLKKEGTIWVNIGDSYSTATHTTDKSAGVKQKTNQGSVDGKNLPSKIQGDCKPKDLVGIPWMLAFALRADGWYLRQDIIWHKPNTMPESVTDRCTKSHEYIFLLSKSERYYFDHEAIQEEAVTQSDVSPKFGGKKYGSNDDAHFQTYSGKEWNPQIRTHNQVYSQAGGYRDNSGGLSGGTVVRNKRDVWSVNVKPNTEAHFATYPQELIAPCILAGCPENGVVLDPFMGSGTTGIVARKLNRNYIGCELNPEYKAMAERRIKNEGENLFNQSTQTL